MNRIFLGLVCLLMFSTSTFAEVEPEYVVVKSTKSPTLRGKSVTYSFTFSGNESSGIYPDSIIYQLDGNGKNKKVKVTNQKFVVKTTAGSHSFVIFHSSSFKEIYTSKIAAKALHNVDVVLYLKTAIEMYEVDKPVIYLYPEKEQAVSVELKTTGKLTFTYPKYENKWEVTANPNGKIKQGDQTYNYLFWESEQQLESKQFLSEGNLVSTSNSLEFLEARLNEFGLTSEEKADFITYWGPKMLEEDQWFVNFVVDDACNQFAELTFEPKPTHVYRLYMILIPANELTLNDVFEVQKLKPIKREGFTVIEWGGSVLSTKNL